jgi:hypothetical protein
MSLVSTLVGIWALKSRPMVATVAGRITQGRIGGKRGLVDYRRTAT